MPTAARRHALHVLAGLDEPGGATLQDRLGRPEVEALPDRERAFLHELVLGTLRRRGRLDAALVRLLDRPLERLDPVTRAALRLGAHQILHLRVPDRAAVSESVDLVGRRPSRGLVNAVLRRLARDGAAPAPEAGTDPLGWLTGEGSLPPWLAERWWRRLGSATACARARAMIEEPPTTFRVNPRLADADRATVLEALGAEPAGLAGVWRTARAADAGRLAREGSVYVQDLGSLVVAALVGEPRQRRILDACAAPGGKSLAIADACPAALVVSAEASPRRLRTLRELVTRWGAERVRCVAADAERPPFRGAFDAVLVDAPCSGLGTLARRPDLRWRAAPEDLPRHSARQVRLLSALGPLVAPEGRLVYAVCSLEPEENDVVVDAFLASHPGWRCAAPTGVAARYSDGRVVRTRPEKDGCDGFYAAVLRRA